MSAYPFTDLVSGLECTLEVTPGCPPVVRHPGCPALADVSAELDAFYCTGCRLSGRVPGAWVMNLLHREPHVRTWLPGTLFVYRALAITAWQHVGGTCLSDPVRALGKRGARVPGGADAA